MKVWVVTGGAATGKSSFSQTLLRLEPGARLVSSDDIVHELLGESENVTVLVKAFGAKILGPTGSIDRAALRSLAFASDDVRRRLEKLLHPQVYSRLEEARVTALAEGVQLFIAEVPLFYEGSASFAADLVILVAAGNATQLRRMVETRGLDVAIAQRILDAQLPLQRKLELAPAVVWNEGSPDLLQYQAQILLQNDHP